MDPMTDPKIDPMVIVQEFVDHWRDVADAVSPEFVARLDFAVDDIFNTHVVTAPLIAGISLGVYLEQAVSVQEEDPVSATRRLLAGRPDRSPNAWLLTARMAYRFSEGSTPAGSDIDIDIPDVYDGDGHEG